MNSYSTKLKNNRPENEQAKQQAEEIWSFLRQFVSPYQVALDSPAAGPRNAEIESAIQNRGKKGCCTFQRENGKYILQKFRPHLIQRSLRTGERLFFCSGTGREMLAYLDTDCHQVWQSPEDAALARRLIECLDLPLYGIGSDRGQNQYLRIQRGWHTPEMANAVLLKLQHAIRLLLAKYECFADFEIKGTIGHLENGHWQRGSFGKLPIHRPEFVFDKFVADLSDGVAIQDLDCLATKIIEQIPQSVLDEMITRKAELYKQHESPYIELSPTHETRLRRLGTWQAAMCTRRELEDGTVLILRSYLEMSKSSVTPLPAASDGCTIRWTSRLPTCDTDHLSDEPDSFKRQHEALLILARRMKCLPTLEQALDYIKENGLYSGDWHDHEKRRKHRVKTLLAYIGKTFDSNKSAKGSVPLGKYDNWVAKEYPHGIKGIRQSNRPDMTVERRSVSVSRQWVSVAMSVIEFLLLIDGMPDGGLPQWRAEQLWNALKNRGAIKVSWDQRKWRLLRETLVAHEVITITDRTYKFGEKAMCWATGKFFPFLRNWAKKAVKALKGMAVQFENIRDKVLNTVVEIADPVLVRSTDPNAQPPPDTS